MCVLYALHTYTQLYAHTAVCTQLCVHMYVCMCYSDVAKSMHGRDVPSQEE